MTYLQIVNGVLRRLRESTVSTYNETEYSTMIGDFVNDALEIVQNAHQWSALFTSITITTAASTQNYTLDGMGEMGQLLDFINDTSNTRMKPASIAWMNTRTNMGGTQEGSPLHFTFNGTANDRDPKIDLWPVPDGVYSLIAKVKKHQSQISDGATEILVPAQPVIQFTYAFAIRERGEVGGTNYNEQMMLAKTMLSDYIQIDKERHPESLYWDSGTINHSIRGLY